MDNKIINYRRTSDYQSLVTDISASLVEEAKTRVSNGQDESLRRLRARHEMAAEIVNHPAYSKWGKNNQAFIENFRKDIKREIGDKVERVIGKSSIYDSLALYEAEPSFEKMVGKLGEGASLTKALSVYLGRMFPDSDKLGNNSYKNCPDCRLCEKHKK